MELFTNYSADYNHNSFQASNLKIFSNQYGFKTIDLILDLKMISLKIILVQQFIYRSRNSSRNHFQKVHVILWGHNNSLDLLVF